MKKIFYHAIVMVAAAGLGLAVGRGLRKEPVSENAIQPSVTEAASENKPTTFARVSKSIPRARPNDDSPLATKLERDLSMSSGVTRWLYWLEAMEKASAADFPRLFQLAEGNVATSRLVSQRWIELHPRHLFDTIVEAVKKGEPATSKLIGLSYELFREWARREPAEIVALLNEPGNFAMSADWRRSAAGEIIRNDAELGVRLFSEWHIDNYSPHMNGVAKWAAADPRHAAEVALANPAGYATEMIMETIGKEWAKSDPARALEFARSHPGDFGSVLAKTTLREWAGRNLNEAAEWLTAADVRTRNHLGTPFVEAWAKQDANSALAWCESNLTGSSLAQAVGGVLRGAAEKDVAAAGALVTSLNPSPARSEAAAAVARKWFPDFSNSKPTKNEAVMWLTGLDGASLRRAVDEVTWSWAAIDPKSMATFLASRGERFPGHTYDIVAREMVRKSPIEALEWAGQLPDERGLSAGAAAFAEWRLAQPEAATKWLGELPVNDPRRAAYFRGAVRSLAWAVQGEEQLAALSGAERALAKEAIRDMNLPEERRDNLLKMLK